MSAHEAFWRWVDDEARRDPESMKKLMDWTPDCSGIDWDILPQDTRDLLPRDEDTKAAWFVESVRQEMLARSAIHQLGMRGPEAQYPETYARFAQDYADANKIGCPIFNIQLATRKQKKPTKDPADRKLKYQIMHLWVPACFWAMTTEGIAALLQELYPRRGEPYCEKTVSDARRYLKLFRLQKPRFWGISLKGKKIIPR
ncbi:MAG TPA: hypothetical protein PLW35_06645 [Verrucomicrobiota bacterium]|nr:hypothetical protein [Verrucomicrobiota bacterium]